jgi:putative DNA primase/helicase
MTNDGSNIAKLAALQDSDGELIAELAGLSPLDYDRRRKEAAEELDVRVGALDDEVAKQRKKLGLDEDQAQPPFPSVEPASEPAAIDGLLHRIADRLKQHVVFPDEAASATALWLAFAWTHDAATHSPMLLVTSAERDSGKTTLLGLVNLLAPRGLMVIDPSPAVLYRLVEKWKPTLVVDEADDQFKENPPLRAVVNSGWTRGAGVPRCDPDTNEPEIFPTFGPKAIGMKGRSIPDTTMSRSITIEMVRKKPGERVADFEHLDDAGLKALRQQLARWAADSTDTLRGARPEMPEGFQNRLAANWRPLLAIADRAGGDWPRLGREAAAALAPKDSSSVSVTLLEDIKATFADKKIDRLWSTPIAEALHTLEGRPWMEWGVSKNRSVQTKSPDS